MNDVLVELLLLRIPNQMERGEIELIQPLGIAGNGESQRFPMPMVSRSTSERMSAIVTAGKSIKLRIIKARVTLPANVFIGFFSIP